jgi:hypothetical protein
MAGSLDGRIVVLVSSPASLGSLGAQFVRLAG